MGKDEKALISNDLIREAVELIKSMIFTSKRYSFECCVGQSFYFKTPRVIINVYDMHKMRCDIAYTAVCHDAEHLAEAIDRVRELIKKDGESS